MSDSFVCSGREVGPILWDIPEDDNNQKNIVLRDLSNTFNGVHNQDNCSKPLGSEQPCPDLWGKVSNAKHYLMLNFLDAM